MSWFDMVEHYLLNTGSCTRLKAAREIIGVKNGLWEAAVLTTDFVVIFAHYNPAFTGENDCSRKANLKKHKNQQY